MCGITAASLAVTAISTAVSMAAQQQQAKQQKSAAQAQADYQQAALDNEIAMQEAQAQDAIARGVNEKNRQQRNAARLMGEQRAMLANAGVELSSGTALDMLGESAMEAQYDSTTIMQNANREAWGHSVSANNALNEKGLVAANLSNTKKAANTSAGFGMGSSFLSGLGTAMGQYNDWKKTQSAKSTAKADVTDTRNAFAYGWR